MSKLADMVDDEHAKRIILALEMLTATNEGKRRELLFLANGEYVEQINELDLAIDIQKDLLKGLRG